jgi:hypothetical protein
VSADYPACGARRYRPDADCDGPAKFDIVHVRNGQARRQFSACIIHGMAALAADVPAGVTGIDMVQR